MLVAAHLLAHAKPEALLWNGSKGAKIGIEHDRDYVARVKSERASAPPLPSWRSMNCCAHAALMRVAIVSPYDTITSRAWSRRGAHGLRGEWLSAIQPEGQHLLCLHPGPEIAEPGARSGRAQARCGADPVHQLPRGDGDSPPSRRRPASRCSTRCRSACGTPALAGIDTRPAAAWGRVFAQDEKDDANPPCSLLIRNAHVLMPRRCGREWPARRRRRRGRPHRSHRPRSRATGLAPSIA